MRRAAQRRRVQRWTRYIDRYVKPPHGYTGVVQPMGYVRAFMRLHGLTWEGGTADVIYYRHSWRTSMCSAKWEEGQHA